LEYISFYKVVLMGFSMGLREFFDKKGLSDEDWEGVAMGEHVPVEVETRWRNAEEVAFARVRRRARALGCDNIYYRKYSGQNPDFMDGTDRMPRSYAIEAVLF
jgi:hypothetical protein